MTEAFSPEVSIRDQAFEQIDRVGQLASSYARSASEAAFRGDDLTMVVALKQLRLCCIYMIRTYKDFLEGKDDEAVPGPTPPAGDGVDRGLGDGDARS